MIDLDQIEELREELKQVEEEAREIRENSIEKVASEIDLANSDIDLEDLGEFMKKPYIVNEQDEGSYQVIVPKFVDFQVGRLEKQVNNYNIFTVDKYTKWIHGVPEFLKDEVEMDDEQHVKVFDDYIEFDDEGEKVVEEVSDQLEEVKDGKATIKQGNEFDLIAELIEQGELPFTAQPVQDEDLRNPDVNFELWEHQQEGYDEWMDNGAVAFCWMTGAGKSFPSMYALDSLEYDPETKKKAVVTNSRGSKQQWEEYFEKFAPRLSEEVEVVTYHSIDKLDGEYILVVFDECHFLPADTFAKGSTIPMKYRMGLSASPYREDGRENYIFALTGKPVGLDWSKTLDLMDKSRHKIEISISDSLEEKLDKAESVYRGLNGSKTMLFCDSIDLGNRLSERLGLNFVSGQDAGDQYEKAKRSLEEDDAVIISRVGDSGLSFDDLEVILEVDFLFGSKRQQLQRSGRLLHGEGEKHVIFFTKGEFNKYEKRLYSLIEKGFSMEFMDQDVEFEVPEKYESRIELNIESGDEDRDVSRSVNSEDMSGIEFLKQDRIKEIINEGASNTDRVKKEDVWETVIAIADSEEGLTSKEIEGLFDKKTKGYRYVSELKDDPKIVEKEGSRFRLKTDNMAEVIEQERQKKERKNRINELKEEVGIK